MQTRHPALIGLRDERLCRSRTSRLREVGAMLPYPFSPSPEDSHRKPAFSELSSLANKYLHLDISATVLTVPL